MLLDDKITKEAYDAKYNELTRKINQAKGERALYSVNVEAQQHISRRMREIRARIAEADMLDKFDRVVFESIVEKVIVGDISEDGTIDPYKHFMFAEDEEGSRNKRMEKYFEVSAAVNVGCGDTKASI